MGIHWHDMEADREHWRDDVGGKRVIEQVHGDEPGVVDMYLENQEQTCKCFSEAETAGYNDVRFRNNGKKE